MTEQPLTLELRSIPTQARSKQTFEHILSTTGQLLEEVGFEAFNTNLLAERANVAVRAIYRYFPNKFSLVLELARRMELDWRDAVTRLTQQEPHAEWPDIWPKYLDRYIDTVRSTPGGVAVLRAMKSHPSLRAIDEEMNAQYIQDIANALQTNATRFTKEKSKQVATLLLTTTVAVIDSTLDVTPRTANTQIDLLKIMHQALLLSTTTHP